MKQSHPPKTAADVNRDEQAADGFASYTDDSDINERESRWNYALVGSGLGVWDHNYRLDKKYYSQTWKSIRGMKRNPPDLLCVDVNMTGSAQE